MRGAFQAALVLAICQAGIAPPAVAADADGKAAARAEPRHVTAVVPRSWPPQYLLDDDGKPAGFAIDVMNEIAHRAGLTVKYVIADNFAAAVEVLQRGDADLIPNSGIVPERMGAFAFTAPIETFAVSLFVRNDSYHVRGVADLMGKKLAVVEKNIGLFMFGKRQDMDVHVYRDVHTALFDLVAGQVDALVYPKPVLLALARNIGIEDRIKIADGPLKEVRRGILVMKQNTVLLALLNRAVEGFVGTPAYQTIYLKWYGRPVPFWTAARIAWAMGGLLLVVLIGMAWWRYQGLQESEIKYRDLIDGSLLAIQIVDREGRRKYVNRAFVNLFGYGTKEEVLALPVGAIAGTSGSDPIRRLRHIRTGKEQIPYTYEFDARRKDGSVVPVEAFARSLVWEGEYAQQRTYIDLTRRKDAEAASRDSEARYRDLIEESILPIQIMSVDRSYQYVNQAYLNLIGYQSMDEFVGIRAKAIAPHDRERITEMAEARNRGEDVPSIYEFDLLRKDGTLVPVQSFSRKILWDGKEANHRTLIDLTDRKNAERSLQESEARFRDLIEGSNLGIQIVLLDGRRVLINRACVELSGYGSAEEFIAAPRWAFVAPHERERVKLFREALLHGDDDTIEYEIDGRRKDGAIVPLHVITRRLVWNGEEAIQRTFIDLTDKKEAEAQLRQAQKVEAVGQLTGGIAHDFNNLLTVIQGNLELISERLHDADLDRMAHNAIDAAGRGADLTQRLLAFSRRQRLAPSIIELDGLVAGMTDLMRRTLGETIEIELAAVDDLWQCKVDSGLLQNAILNLALNARDAMPQGGRLIIRTANVAAEDIDVANRYGVSPGRYVMISVSDTGKGMSREILDHAIEPFFTTKDVGAGSGLGLSMVYGFINQSGGHMNLESQEGAGTTVTMYLPRSAEQAGTGRQSHDAADPESLGEKVLVVEDDPHVRALTVNMLTGLGYHTLEAVDGQAAMAVLQRTADIDLLFTDIGLPGGMSGVDVAGEARRRIPGIRILFTSGYADEMLAKHRRMDENIQLINKPFRKAELARVVRTALDDSIA